MRVRTVAHDDLAALGALWKAFEEELPEPPWIEVDLDRELAVRLPARMDGEIALVAEDGDRLAGFAFAHRAGRGLGRITDLYVVPSARGDGVATALVAEVVRRLCDLGLETVVLEVLASNEGARAVYDRWGFREQELTLSAPLATLARRLAKSH